MQAQFQPELMSLIPQYSVTDADVDAVQDTPLCLPSSLPPGILGKCSKRLVSMETELRIGQCRDSLTQLRTKLCAKARLLKHKFVHVRHQAPNTRSRNLLHRIEAKINVVAAKYDHAFAALQTLDPERKSGWGSDFQVLGKQDLRCLSEADLPDAPTRERAEKLQARSLLNGGVVPEGNRKVSWIWRGSLATSGSSDAPNVDVPNADALNVDTQNVDTPNVDAQTEFGEGRVFPFFLCNIY